MVLILNISLIMLLTTLFFLDANSHLFKHGCQSSGNNIYGQLGIDSKHPVNRVPQAGKIYMGKKIKNFSGGLYHVVMSDDDDHIYGVGRNKEGQLGDGTNMDRHVPVLVKRLNKNKVHDVVTGMLHTLFLDDQGKVYGMGQNGEGQLCDGTTEFRNEPVSVKQEEGELVGKRIVKIAAGGFSTLFLDSDGFVYGCGWNLYGQLGIGKNSNQAMPIRMNYEGVLKNRKVVDIAVAAHTLLLDDEGKLYATGLNSFGQCGDGTTINRFVPVEVDTLTKIIKVTAGDFHSLVLDENFDVWGFGSNQHGQLGDFSTIDRHTPVQMNFQRCNASSIVEIAAGNNHNILMDDNQRIFGVGMNNHGQLSRETDPFFDEPIEFHDLDLGDSTDNMRIECTGFSSMFLNTEGILFSVGANFEGQLSDGTTISSSQFVESRFLSIVSVSSSHEHSIWLDINGVTYSAGNTEFGETTVAREISSSEKFISHDAGKEFSLLLTMHGQVYSFGNNEYGQLGDGSTISRSNLQAIDGILEGRKVIQVSAGKSFSLMLDSEGNAYGAGSSEFGQLGTEESHNRPIRIHGNQIKSELISQISAGEEYSLLLTFGGKVFGMGRNQYAQLGTKDGKNRFTPTPMHDDGVLTNRKIIQVAAGVEHSLLLDENGILIGCGRGFSGELSSKGTLNSPVPILFNLDHLESYPFIVQIAAGERHSMFLSANGMVYSSGQNNFGQLGDGTITDQINPTNTFVGSPKSFIAAGKYSSFAISNTVPPICPIGYYPNETVCIQCQPFYLCSTGQSRTFCPKGEESVVYGSFSCQPCKIGFFKYDEESVCTPCPPGFYSGEPGSPICKPCEIGTYSDGLAAKECIPCRSSDCLHVGSSIDYDITHSNAFHDLNPIKFFEPQYSYVYWLYPTILAIFLLLIGLFTTNISILEFISRAWLKISVWKKIDCFSRRHYHVEDVNVQYRSRRLGGFVTMLAMVSIICIWIHLLVSFFYTSKRVTEGIRGIRIEESMMTKDLNFSLNIIHSPNASLAIEKATLNDASVSFHGLGYLFPHLRYSWNCSRCSFSDSSSIMRIALVSNTPIRYLQLNITVSSGNGKQTGRKTFSALRTEEMFCGETYLDTYFQLREQRNFKNAFLGLSPMGGRFLQISKYYVWNYQNSVESFCPLVSQNQYRAVFEIRFSPSQNVKVAQEEYSTTFATLFSQMVAAFQAVITVLVSVMVLTEKCFTKTSQFKKKHFPNKQLNEPPHSKLENLLTKEEKIELDSHL